MAGPSIFNRARIPLDSAEPIPEATEQQWKAEKVSIEAPQAPQAPAPEPQPAELVPQGKAKARKVGKPPEEPKPENRICSVILRASGAGQETCNQDYRYCGLHQGKAMYKAENGAVIYFNKMWKMNKIFKTTGWIYCMKDSTGGWPGEGRWSSEGTNDPNGAGRPPSLTLVDEPLARQVAEESGAWILEDGSKVLKREENKSWRWSMVLTRSKEDILRSLLERPNGGPSGLAAGFHEPEEPPPPPAPAPRAAPAAPAVPAKPPTPMPLPAAPSPVAPSRREERPERSGFGASSRRFRPCSSTRESLAQAVAERKQLMRKMESQADAEPALPELPEPASELVVGGEVFTVKRLDEGPPPSLQSMLAYIDAESKADDLKCSELREREGETRGYRQVAEAPKAKAGCPPGPAAYWGCQEVSQYLEYLGLSHIEEKFKENAVDGQMLMELTEEDLCKELGLLKLQAKKLVSRLPRDEVPTAG